MNRRQAAATVNTGTVIMYMAIFAGIALRFAFPALKPLTPQEASFANIITGRGFLEAFFTSLASNPQPPAFDFLTWAITSLFGVSEASLRFLPAVFGTASIFVVQKMTRSFYSERMSIFAVSFFALNPFFIFLSRSCSPASMFLFTSLMMVYYFMLSVKYNSFVMGPFIFWSIAGLYTHHNTIILLVVLNIVLFFRYKDEIRMNLWIRSQIYTALAWLPLSIYLVKGISSGVYPWPNPALLPLFFYKEILLGPQLGFNPVTILFLLGVSLFLLVGIVTLRNMKEKRMTDIMTIIAAALPAVPWALELFKIGPYGPQLMALSGVLIIILIAVGASHLSQDGTVLFSVITVLFYSWAAVLYFYQPDNTSDVRKIYSEISSQYAQGDMVFNTDAEIYAPLEFYNTHMNGKKIPDRIIAPVPEFRGNTGLRGIWRGIRAYLAEKKGIDVYAGYDKNITGETAAAGEARAASRIWLVGPDSGPWINNGFKKVSVKSFGGTNLTLFEKK
jgi:hypothetical protein